MILNLPDVAGSAFNRYYTVEFYEQVKAALRAGGVVAVSIAGGEDVMGAELVGLGASTQRTLARVFSNQVLVPGEQTWLIASDSTSLTGDPAILRDRFAAMEGSQKVFPAAGLLSVYLPDRTAEAKLAYEKADLPRAASGQPGRTSFDTSVWPAAGRPPVGRFRHTIRQAAGPQRLAAVPCTDPGLRRVADVGDGGAAPGESPSSFDSTFLVFSTGWVGIAMVILLMYLYETHFGSLYLHVGLISSVFMAGLTAGALFVGRVIARRSDRTQHIVLVAILVIHAVVLAALALCLAGMWAGDDGTLRDPDTFCSRWHSSCPVSVAADTGR